MSEFNIREAVLRLEKSVNEVAVGYAEAASLRLFNLLVEDAQLKYPGNLDFKAMRPYPDSNILKGVWNSDFRPAVKLLSLATTFLSDEPIRKHGKFKILRDFDQLEDDYQRLFDEQHPIGVIFFDIDKFKDLNESHTETRVDEGVLKPFMRLVLDVLGQRGFAYSVGGDEFIILLHNSEAFESEAFAKRLLRETIEYDFKIDDATVKISLSMGVSCSRPGNLSLHQVKLLANDAERSAKKMVGIEWCFPRHTVRFN